MLEVPNLVQNTRHSFLILICLSVINFFSHFINVNLTNSASYLTSSLHNLMGLYANLIYMNWSYDATKTTKAKKPYLEKLIFCNLQAGLIPLLELVGLFLKNIWCYWQHLFSERYAGRFNRCPWHHLIEHSWISILSYFWPTLPTKNKLLKLPNSRLPTLNICWSVCWRVRSTERLLPVHQFRRPMRQQTKADVPPHLYIMLHWQSNGHDGCHSPVCAWHGLSWCILYASRAVHGINSRGGYIYSLAALRASADDHAYWAINTRSRSLILDAGGDWFWISSRAWGWGACHGLVLGRWSFVFSAPTQ